MKLTPILTVMFASLLQTLPIFAGQPAFPPLGFMMLLAWRLPRPNLLPIWIGAPLGLFDDLMSGQPLGSAVVIWSAALLFVDIIEDRMPWRDFWQDWLIAAICITSGLLLGMLFVGIAHPLPGTTVLIPQMIGSVLLFPLAIRICAALDQWRTAR